MMMWLIISGGGSIGPEDCLEIDRRVGADCSFFKLFDIQLLVATVEDLIGPRKK